LLGEEIGIVHVDNILLRPGLDNNFTMHANISQTPVLNTLRMQPYCETGFLPFQLLGKSVENRGQNLSYFADALAISNQTINIDIGSDVRALGFPVKCSS
jgi:hypothetical protein